MSGTFRAMFDGTCTAACEFRVHPGDLVRYVDDQLFHAECAPKPDPLDQEQPAVVCGVCWTVRPCRCEA